MRNIDKYIILGKMSALLAHEIRNPLAGISAVTQVLEGKMESNNPLRKYVSLIMKEIDRVNKIVHDLLDYTRDSRLFFIQSDLTTIAERALAAYKEEVEKKEIEIAKCYDMADFRVQADQDKIERVFKSIIINALESMENNGCLTITARRLNRLNGHGSAIEISFSDTGKGTDLQDLNEMFSPFYTTKPKGTGLGLAIGLKIVEEHNGKLCALRNSGKGLTFTVILPVEQLNEESNTEKRNEGIQA